MKQYPVMEHFYSIQGEGGNTGAPAYFVRLGGCDVGCHWCDVKESWEAEKHPLMSVAEILSEIKETNAKMVVVTGGEPTLHDLEPLTKALNEAGIQLFIETAGTNQMTGDWHWICLSPKKFKVPVESVYPIANELKVIVFNKHDLQWAEEHAEKVNDQCKLYLQPEWSREPEVLPMMINYVKNNPKWRISLQTHKYMNIP